MLKNKYKRYYAFPSTTSLKRFETKFSNMNKIRIENSNCIFVLPDVVKRKERTLFNEYYRRVKIISNSFDHN